MSNCSNFRVLNVSKLPCIRRKSVEKYVLSFSNRLEKRVHARCSYSFLFHHSLSHLSAALCETVQVASETRHVQRLRNTQSAISEYTAQLLAYPFFFLLTLAAYQVCHVLRVPIKLDFRGFLALHGTLMMCLVTVAKLKIKGNIK